MAHHIERALKGEIRIAEAVAARGPDRSANLKAFHVIPDVVIDNALSTRYTVVEVTGLDRPGLLYELTTALSKLNLNIGSAHVATFGEKAVDVFYVTDLTGSKIVNSTRQTASAGSSWMCCRARGHPATTEPARPPSGSR